MNWLEQLYRNQCESLFHLAWLVLRDVGLAEDAVHSAFVKLSKADSAPQDSLNYVRQTVRNQAIDLLRSRKVRAADQLTEVVSTGTEDSLDASDFFEAMLLKLTQEQREVVEFRLRLGLSFKEIANLLGEPLSTVSSRYQRTIDFLQRENEVHNE